MRDSDTLLKIIHECQNLEDRYDPHTGHYADTVFTPHQAKLMGIVLINLGQLRIAALKAEKEQDQHYKTGMERHKPGNMTAGQ